MQFSRCFFRDMTQDMWHATKIKFYHDCFYKFHELVKKWESLTVVFLAQIYRNRLSESDKMILIQRIREVQKIEMRLYDEYFSYSNANLLQKSNA